MKHLNYIAILVIFFIAFCTTNCSKADSDCDPDAYCETIPYDSGYVDIEASYKGIGIPIIVYEGYLEDNNILFYDTMWDTKYSYYLPLGKRYSVEAYYYEANQTIIALDGDKLKESYYWNCSDKCYSEAEIALDVKKL